MDQPSDKIRKFLIVFVIGILIFKSFSSSGLFDAKDHKGPGYVVVPVGWKKLQKPKNIVFPQGVEVVTFVPKNMYEEGEQPKIYITMYSKKLTSPIWIEDEFPDILHSIKKEGMDIKDRGRLPLDELDAHWLVYYNKKVDALFLEFYMVSESNNFYKLQYSAPPYDFNPYRRSFDELKDSFELRFSLI